METLALGVWRSLQRACPDARRISLGRSNVHLVWWMPWMVARVGALLARHRVDRVLFGDALTYAVVTPWIRLFRVPCVVIVNGLDVTYPNAVYRALVLPRIRSAPKVLAISAATCDAVESAGVPRERIGILPLGLEVLDVSAADRAAARQQVWRRLSLGQDAVLLLTVGRLVRRKGAAWFISDVLPQLPPTVHYALAGEGTDEARIVSAAEAAGVRSRVHLLGRVDEAVREELLRGADLFIQPNIAVPGDMEGFGLVTIEAALRGTPVVAADLQGLRDAVAHERTGLLLPSGDAEIWVSTIADLTAKPAALVRVGRRFAAETAERYSEAAMAAVLTEELSPS
jgi:phosphatidylinositol alpha-1,6-mannosyltransferase